MITAYHRPHTLEEALILIARESPLTLPLGGGTYLSHGLTESIEVVDLQLLGINDISHQGNNLIIGSATTLQQLLENEHRPVALLQALKLEAPLNIRNSATIAGTIVTCDGRSTTCTALLAIDAKIKLESMPRASSARQVAIHPIGDLLPLRPKILSGRLITNIEIPLNAKFAFEYVSRTPADKPILCVALAKWPSGRTRLAVGGFGKAPTTAMDGTEDQGIEEAVRNACHEADDDRGSASYRMDIAATLAKRCLADITA